jgi:hypothetical protein
MVGRRVVVVLLAVVSKCQCFVPPSLNLPRLQLSHQRTSLATSTVPQSDSVWGPLEQVSNAFELSNHCVSLHIRARLLTHISHTRRGGL